MAFDVGAIEAIMTAIAELLSARGGTMTAGALEGDLLTVANRSEALPDTAQRLRQHITAQGARIAALEATIGTAQHEVAAMDAALRVVIPDIEARLSSTCVWCGTPAPHPVTTESLRAHVAEHVSVCQKHPMRALEQHISDLEKSLENARKERADALASATRGWEVADAFHVQKAVDHLKPSGQVAEDAKELREFIVATGRLPRPLSNVDRLAAKAQGYAAAVADNAALVEHARTERQMLSLLYHRIKALGVQDATDAMTDAVTTVERWMDVVPDTYEQPHPGAALLEQHRKEVEALQAVVTGLAEEMEAAIRENERPKGGMSVPFHGDFASAPPSMLGRMRWWAREMRSALGGNTSALLDRMKRLEGALERIALESVDNPSQHARHILENDGVVYAPVVLTMPAYTARITGISDPACTDGSCAKCRSGDPCH